MGLKNEKPTFDVDAAKVLDGELKDFCLFQLSGALFFECRRHKSPQFGQRVVDSVAAPFLDDSAAPLACHCVARVATFHRRQTPENTQKTKI
jgi:hypothetical protein